VYRIGGVEKIPFNGNDQFAGAAGNGNLRPVVFITGRGEIHTLQFSEVEIVWHVYSSSAKNFSINILKP
jgi:hypothetical protein